MGIRQHPHRPRARYQHRDRPPRPCALRRLRQDPRAVAAALQVRRADTTDVIGTPLVHKANGLGYRRIAERLDRPESTVRRWLRRVPPEHLHWMFTQGCERPATYATDAFSRIRNTRNPLHHTLTVLAAAAFHARERFGFEDPPWALIGMYTRGRLLVPPRSG